MSENHLRAVEIPDDLSEFPESEGAEPQAPNFHPILEVWREVLKPALTEKLEKVTPEWANKIVSSYAEIRFADMNRVRDLYFDKIIELKDILDAEIATDPDCLKVSSPEEDAEENGTHYKNLLLLWQSAFMQWQLNWTCTDEDAAAETAAISEVHKMFFGQTGVVAYLQNIQFEFTEDDQALVHEALESLKAGA